MNLKSEELSDVLQQLAEARIRLEATINELVESQRRIEQTVNEMAAAQRRKAIGQTGSASRKKQWSAV